MGRLVRRMWLRRPLPRVRRQARRPSGGQGGSTLLLSAILGIGLALLAICAFDAGVRPIIVDMAQAKVENAVTKIINSAVGDTIAAEAVAYDSIVTIEKDDAGRITAMSTSSAKMNALRTQILSAVVTQVDSLDSETLGIPLGNLTGLASASGRGPLLPVRVVAVASSDAQFENFFTAAGINQTLHRVMLNVSVSVKLLIPNGTVESEVTAQVSVAETVIVGEVPDAYLQFAASPEL